MIAESNLEGIQSFEKLNCSRICKDAISFGYCEVEDIPGYFRQIVYKYILPGHVNKRKM